MIRLFNTLSGRVEPFEPTSPGEVRLYTCGPTVYDYAHIGNFRAYVFEDLLKRFLIFEGFRVKHVMNITDVDDKTIKGANSQGIGLAEYTKTYIDAFFEDIGLLRIAPADLYPRATEHIPEMVAFVKGLVEKEYAYQKDGSCYFSIAKFPAYGKLSKINREELRPGQRLDLDEYAKESADDFALWKAKKAGEPFWETEIGPGRPGWHIECSAMSMKYLGQTLDIHTGGVDNIFPHHENELAQSEALTGKRFVNHWLHCHHLIVDGEKMSKSKGNFYTLRDLLQKGVDPAALRFLLLSTHYRKQLNFTFPALEQAAAALQRIDEFAGELQTGRFPEGETPAVSRLLDEAHKKFRAGLSDDLNISVALTSLFNLIKRVNTLISQGKVRKKDAEKLGAFLSLIDSVLAVVTPTKKVYLEGQLHAKSSAEAAIQVTPHGLPVEVWEKIQAREKARADKNFALADQIRNELASEGIIVEDTKEGVRWKTVPSRRQEG